MGAKGKRILGGRAGTMKLPTEQQLLRFLKRFLFSKSLIRLFLLAVSVIFANGLKKNKIRHEKQISRSYHFALNFYANPTVTIDWVSFENQDFYENAQKT